MCPSDDGGEDNDDEDNADDMRYTVFEVYNGYEVHEDNGDEDDADNMRYRVFANEGTNLR